MHACQLILIIFFSTYSCIKPDIAPRLEIQVVNESGTAVVGALISLYEDVDEWGMQKNPLQVWKRTDSEGRALFIGLSEIVYYFYIIKDNMDNSDGFIKLAEPLIENKIVTIEVMIK